MLKKLLVLIGVAIIVFAVIASRQPDEFTIARSIAIHASPAKVFSHVNNLHAWEAWSPWMKLDPKATATYAGPAAGKGASMKWSGNMQVGEGTMTIIETHPDAYVRFRLDFARPMAATNTADFSFQPDGHQTVVRWSMSGHNNFIQKAISLLMNCDKMVGGQFDKGLTQLKVVVESSK